ncbi:MAG: solute carrier family 23 protein [Bacilli bacterium]|jgi:uracil permease
MIARLEKKKATSFITFLGYLLKILFVTATAMMVGGMNLTLGLLFAGVFSFAHLFLSRGQFGTFFAPNFLFIPLVYRTLNSLDYQLFPNDYLGAIGELVVAFWLAGILHIILAIIARYIPYQKLRRAFPPYLIGALSIVLAFSFLLLVGGEYLIVPLIERTAFPFIPVLGLLFTILLAHLIKTKAKKESIFREAYFFFALLGGTVFYFGMEVIAYGAALQEGTPHLFLMFTGPNALSWRRITPFQQQGELFGYLDHLRFNWDLALAIIPLTIIAFFELFEAVKNDQRLLLNTSLNVADYDRFLFANGLSLMLSSAAGVSPFYAQRVYDERLAQKEERRLLLFAVIAIMVLAIWQWFNNIFYLIPPLIYLAITAYSFMVIIGHGYQMIKVSFLEQGDKKNIIIATIIVVAGGGFAVLNAINAWTGLNFGVITIENVQLNPLLIIMALGILLNIVIPRRKKKEKSQERRT